jgi:HEAT repeat protein
MWALVALACLAISTSPNPVGAVGATSSPSVVYDGGDELMERELWDLLAEAGTQGTVLEEVVDRIVRKGERAVPVLFAILCGGLTEPDDERRWDRSAGPGRDEASARDWVIVDALSRMPSEAVFPYLRAVAGSETTTDVRLSVALVLAESTDPSALAVLLEVLAGLESTHLAANYVADRAQDSLGRLLDRHPRMIRALDTESAPLPSRLQPIVVEALPEAAVESSRFLVGLFGQSDELDVRVMRRLSQFAQSPLGAGDLWTQEESLAKVRAHLTHPDWKTRREAIVALGYLHDVDSYSDLIRLLDDEERGVQRSALWSLERISGRTLDDAGAWLRFFEGEKAWFQGYMAELESRLSSRNDAAVVEAVRDLSRRALFRHRITEVLAPQVGRSNPVIVEVVCSALVQLDSPRAIPVLVQALDHPDNRCLKAIWKALKSTSGRSLPPVRETWENELGL